MNTQHETPCLVQTLSGLMQQASWSRTAPSFGMIPSKPLMQKSGSFPNTSAQYGQLVIEVLIRQGS